MSVRFKFDFEKTHAVVLFLAGRGLPEFTVYKAIKLIFLADKHHLVTYGRPITGDEYVAMEFGPVPSKTYDLLGEVVKGQNLGIERQALASTLEIDKKFKYPRMKAAADFNRKVLSKSDIESLEKVANLHGQKDFFELGALTHEMPAFKKIWDNRPKDSKREEMFFEDFFEQEADALAGVFEEMVENFELMEAFPEPA